MNYIVWIRITLVLGLIFAGAQKPAEDRAFTQFWTKFRDAVVTQDQQAVGSMTKVPFLFEGKPRNRRGFVKICDQLFDRKIRTCFATSQPKQEGDLYEVFCGQNIFYFGLSEGEYKFIEFGADY